jgi:SAM-dependent methyltransferase
VIFFKHCPLCSSPNLVGYAIDVKRNGPHMSRVQCDHCDIVFANPMADLSELSEFYQSYYNKGNFEQLGYTDLVIKKKLEVGQMSYADLCKEADYIFEFKKAGKFLDVGAGLGAVLLYVDRPEFELYATEFDADALAFITKSYTNPVNIFQGDLVDAKYPDNYFDYICCNHVIEHVIDPVGYLQEMYRILKKDGILFLGTPDRKSNLYKLYRLARYAQGNIPAIIDGIEHTFIFSKKNLLELCEKAGFEKELHRSIPLRDSFKNIFGGHLSFKKKIARYIQTFFYVNQELICRKLK